MEIDPQKLLDRIDEDAQAVMFDIGQGRWRKFYAIDAREGYLRGLLLLDDPRGSTPARDLTMTHAERLRIERSGQAVTYNARPGMRISRNRTHVLRNA